MQKIPYENRDQKLEVSGKIIGFYEREYYCFSNFSSFQVEWKGYLWPTSEHAFQASRFLGKNQKIVALIRQSKSADAAYKIAQKYKSALFDNYHQNDIANMTDICHCKLQQNPYVRHKLIQTGKRLIIEDSPKDSFWGWGPDKRGLNHLGKIWMKLRNELK